MKKAIICITMIAAFMPCASVFAASYNTNDNTISNVPDGSYRTVLIIKDGVNPQDADIVYAGQTESGTTFSESTSFMLKENPSDGLYTVRLGGKTNGDAADSLSFYIGMPITSDDKRCDAGFKDNDGLAFGWEQIESAGIRSIIVKINDEVYAANIKTEFAGGAVSIGYRITDIPSDIEIKSYDAYLSTNMVGKEMRGENDQ